jgi:Arc/MetJ-type ribon-helix-helix transcriptional regulator
MESDIMSKENESLMHITLTKALKDKIKEIKANSSYSTISDFVREAIREKIRRMENPELFNTSKAPSYTQEYMEEIKSTSLENNKLVKLMLEKMKTLNEIDKTTYSLKNLTLNGLGKENWELKTEKIYNTLVKYGELSVREIKEKTGFNRIVVDILNAKSNEHLFKMNINNGKWGAIQNE